MPETNADQVGAHPAQADADSVSQWCDRAAQGDSAALSHLHDRFTPGLIRHFLRRCNGQPTIAEDLAQQTWIAFWRALVAGTYDPRKARPSTFLYAVAKNIWLRHLRAAGRASEHVMISVDAGAGAPGGALTDRGPDPAESAALAESIELARAILAGGVASAKAGPGLSDDDRAILRSIAAGRSDRELAAQLGVAASTAHARKKAALDRFAQAMKIAAGILPAGRAHTGHRHE